MPIDGSSNPDIPSMYKLLLATRKRQGFTIAHWAFLGRIHGKSAFEDFGRTRTVDLEFWHTVDRYVALTNDAGIVPVIAMGWAGRPLKREQWQTLWQYVVARYGASSVTWLVCGEYNVRGVSDAKIRDTLKVGAFIKSVDPWKRAMTIHPWYYIGDRHQAWKESWYDFIMFQGGHGEKPPPLDVYYRAWQSRPVRPVLEGECAYEGIHRFQAADVRNRAWRAFMAGCFGYTYGSHGLWYPTQNAHDMRTHEWGRPTPWWVALKRPGADHLGCMKRILERVPWYRLQPKPDAIALAELQQNNRSKGSGIVVNLADRFEEAKAEHALWCKRIERRWGGTQLVEIELHPEGAKAATLRWPSVALPKLKPPQHIRLVVALGMDEATRLNDPKHPSDGVTYSVVVNGKTLLCEHRKTKKWEHHSFDLTDLAGRDAVSTLKTEAGKNSAWDHARFRGPVIVRTGELDSQPLYQLYTTTFPEQVLVKAEGQRLFLVYFPSVSEQRRPDIILRGLAPKTEYHAWWCDPRTGTQRQRPTMRATDAGTAPLPCPPDRQDWVLLLAK